MNDRVRNAVLLLVALALTSATTGCLFPPVEADDGTGGDEGLPPPFETDDPDAYVTKAGHQTKDGEVAPGFLLTTQTVGAQSIHLDMVLPPRLTAVTVTLEWTDSGGMGRDQVSDLDLEVRIELITHEGAEAIWTRADHGGGPGNPDAPVVLESNEDETLAYDNNTELKATIIPEASAGGIDWNLTVDYFYLVPRGA